MMILKLCDRCRRIIRIYHHEPGKKKYIKIYDDDFSLCPTCRVEVKKKKDKHNYVEGGDNDDENAL